MMMQRTVISGATASSSLSRRLPLLSLSSAQLPSAVMTPSASVLSSESNHCVSIHTWNKQQLTGCTGTVSNPIVISTRNFSSSTASKDAEKSSSGGGGITGWMAERSKRKQQEQYVEQMERLSNLDKFTMKDYREELQRGLSGWAAKISFMESKEIKMAKEVLAVVDKFVDVIGPDATAEDLIGMDRLQRLKVATASNKSLEDISIMISQITNMDVMQKALRKRRLEGKSIPKDPEAMQNIIKRDAINVLSKSQKEMLKSRQEDAARRMARKRRK
jgi:hypothetical protein